MNFKLAVVGHTSSINEISEIIKTRFKNIDVFTIAFNSDEQTDQAESDLRKIIKKCNGVLYTRFDPYKIMTGRFEHNLPVRYVDVDTASLVHSFFEALYHLNADVRKISVDTLDLESILSAYRSVGIDENETDIHLVHIDPSDYHFVQKTEDDHRMNYYAKKCSVCITNIRSVKDNLQKEGIACVLLAPSAETYMYEIRRLIISHNLIKTSVNQMVYAAISLQPRNDFFIYSQSVLQETLDRNKAVEYIAIYAQKVNGMMLALSASDYVIICNSQDIEAITENYANIDILRSISANTSFIISIGVGYGENLKAMKAHGEIGLQRSLTSGGNSAHIVYSPSNIVGPIEPNEIIVSSSNIFEQRLVQIAESSGLSINTVYKIDNYAREKKNNSVTSSEIADHLGVSIRTANRIIAKLELGGYVVEIGKHIVGVKGRPTRMLKILF